MIRGISEEAIRAVQAYHRAAMERQKHRLESHMATPPDPDTESGESPGMNAGTERSAASSRSPQLASPQP